MAQQAQVLSNKKSGIPELNPSYAALVERTSFSLNISKPHFIHEISKINHCK